MARVMVAQTPSPDDDRIRAALWFAEHGFRVFSVWSPDPKGGCRCPAGKSCDNNGKHPIGGQGFKDATDDPGRIRTLLSAASHPNYGLVCPEGVFAWDVDGDGVALLAELEQQYGPLPPTLRTKTRNGEHVFLRWPVDLPRPIGQMFGYVTRWGSGRDAGYVIGPRSVHASGYIYEPVAGTFDIADLPAVWAEAVVTAHEPSEEALITITGDGYQLPDYGFTGSRYIEILRFLASRYKKGIPLDEIWVGVVYSLAPRFAEPLDEQGLRTRFERAWKGTAERLGPPGQLDDIPAIIEIPHDIPAPPVMDDLWPEPPAEAAYHGVLGEIVRTVEPTTEADPIAILGSLLATAGACMGGLRYLYQGSAQTPNVFVTIVGDSSSGRKGTAMSIARDVMGAAYPDWQKLIVAGLGSGEGLIAHLKRMEDTDSRAIVTESEFGRLLTVMAREGSTLSPVVRDAWDGVPMGRFLAREQSLVTRHHVGIVAHVTPVELRAKLTGVDAANGFANRFLWLCVRRTRLVPFPESPSALITPFVAPLHRAIEDAQTPAQLEWSVPARDAWEGLYAELSTRPRIGLLGALVARMEAQIARLSLLYALLDRASEVRLEHLHAGRALWDYAERSVRYIFGSGTGNRHADALRDLVVDGPVEWQEAKKSLGLRTAADLREAVEILTTLGICEVVPVPRPGGGRPRRAIRLTGAGEQTAQRVQTAPAPVSLETA